MATIFEDDFNSYTDGDLNTQGGWGGKITFDVQGVVVKEGAKAVINQTAGDQTMSKDGVALTDGKISFYARVHDHANWGSGKYIIFVIHSGSPWLTHPSILAAKFGQDGWLAYDGGNILEFNDDQWYLIECEWRSSPDYKERVRIDGGAWQDWAAGYGGDWTAGLKAFGINYYCASGDPAYFDYIAEEPYVAVKPKSFGYIF